MKLQTDIENAVQEQTHWDITNPQLLWNQYKEDIKTTAKDQNKETHHKITSRAKCLQKDLHNVTQHPNFDTDETMQTTKVLLANELEHLEKVQARDKKDKLRTEIAVNGKKLGGIWSALSKENKPRDVIYRLRIPNSNPPQYERCS